MALVFYNTLTRKKEPFMPLQEGRVGLYSCGPTVYNFAHVGNLRAYLFVDLLKRYLLYKGFAVKHIMNLTDVDDKTIRDSQKEGISLKEFTERYTKYFFEDLDTLNIISADAYPKATEHIPEMVAIIKKLIEKGIAYKTADGIYFDIRKFKGYGDLAHIDIEGLKTQARVKSDEYDKEHAQDFALWKFWDKNDGDVYWETEIGKGRPGWHIECSAMSTKYLGERFDIHTGGVDLIFPHHQNEIAQSEAVSGVQFVNYWLHNAHLMVDGRKMSKSLGNFYTLRDLVAKGNKPLAIRLTLISTHYRQDLNLTSAAIEGSQKSVERLNDFAARLSEVTNEEKKNDKKVERLVAKAKKNFEENMDDDLNIAEALAVIYDLMKEANILLGDNRISKNAAAMVLAALKGFDRVLGILEEKDKSLEQEIEDKIAQREAARKARDFKLSDNIRDELLAKGIILEDTKQGVRWRRA